MRDAVLYTLEQKADAPVFWNEMMRKVSITRSGESCVIRIGNSFKALGSVIILSVIAAVCWRYHHVNKYDEFVGPPTPMWTVTLFGLMWLLLWLAIFWRFITSETITVTKRELIVDRGFGPVKSNFSSPWQDLVGPILVRDNLSLQDLVLGDVFFAHRDGFEKRIGCGLSLIQQQQMVNAILKAKSSASYE